MPKQKLFDEESEDEVELKTENDYAKKYDQWRGKEEIHKLEQKYGTKVLNSDASLSSDSEDESDEPPEVSEEMETQFLKTLALLKKKDPRIYDPGFKFYDEKEKELVKKTKEQTLTFADSDDDDDEDGDIFSIEKKAEVDDGQVVEGKDNSSAKPGQDGKLKDYLVGKVDHIDNTAEKDLEPLKALWSDPKLNEGEAFLRDYILNKKYLEEGEGGGDSGGEGEGEGEGRLRDDAELGADERMVEEQDKFERAFNFRFEEPDQEYLKRFPRTMNYIRPKDERRAKKRVELRARKEDERTRKMEEIARLKALKLHEIQEKIAKIKEVTGNEELAFKDEDIEGEFDPEEHDRRMRAIFDEQYYGDVDEEKPVFPDLDKELEIENWDKYEPGQESEAQDFSMEGPHCEDAEFNMDADFDPKSSRSNLIEEMRRSLGTKRRNRKNKSKLAKLLSSDKPKFIPTQEDTYAQYMDEYYKMDCEDVIGGDLPTRFKYREVVPNDYGLTVEEILLADDKELTQWVPLKKIVRHKPESAQKSEIHAYAQKAADPRLKRKVLPSLFKNLPEEPELVVSKEENSKKKNKKKKNKQKDTSQVEPENTANVESAEEIVPNADEYSEQNGSADDVNEEKVGKKKGKRKNKEVSTDTVNSRSIGNGDSGEGVIKENAEVNGTTNIKSTKKNKKKRKVSVDSDVNNTNIKGNKKKVKENVLIEDNSEKQSKKERVVNTDSDVTTNKIVKVVLSDLSKRQKKNLKKKIKKKGIIVENVTNATPGKISQSTVAKKRKLTENDQVPIKKPKNDNFNKEGNKKSSNKDGGKKKPLNKGDKNKNIKNNKFKNKDKQNNDRFKNKIKQIIDKNKSNDADNPMSTLSDERLKAYGLNPKKYRSFLKYKKF